MGAEVAVRRPEEGVVGEYVMDVVAACVLDVVACPSSVMMF